MAEKHTIEIHVDARGNFSYSQALLHVRPGDRIRWVCDDGDFAVSFIEHTPFADKFEFQGFQGDREEKTSLGELPEEGLRPGAYHYRVAVARPVGDRKGRRKVFVDSGCPGMEFP